MQPEDVQRLVLAKWTVDQDNKTMYVAALKSNTVQGIIFGLVILYLAFLIYLRPEPPGYLPEILAKRAAEFEAIHKATPHESLPLGGAGADVPAGGRRKQGAGGAAGHPRARPKSEYGQWATRMRAQLSRGGRGSERVSKEGPHGWLAAPFARETGPIRPVRRASGSPGPEGPVCRQPTTLPAATHAAPPRGAEVV